VLNVARWRRPPQEASADVAAVTLWRECSVLLACGCHHRLLVHGHLYVVTARCSTPLIRQYPCLGWLVLIFVPHWEKEVKSSQRHRLSTTNTSPYADLAISFSLSWPSKRSPGTDLRRWTGHCPDSCVGSFVTGPMNLELGFSLRWCSAHRTLSGNIWVQRPLRRVLVRKESEPPDMRIYCPRTGELGI